MSTFWSLVLEYISDLEVPFRSEAETEGEVSYEKMAHRNRKSHVSLGGVGMTRYSGSGSCGPISDKSMNLELCKKAKFLLKVEPALTNGSCCRQPHGKRI